MAYKYWILKDLGLEEFEGTENIFPDDLPGREVLDEVIAILLNYSI